MSMENLPEKHLRFLDAKESASKVLGFYREDPERLTRLARVRMTFGNSLLLSFLDIVKNNLAKRHDKEKDSFVSGFSFGYLYFQRLAIEGKMFEVKGQDIERVVGEMSAMRDYISEFSTRELDDVMAEIDDPLREASREIIEVMDSPEKRSEFVIGLTMVNLIFKPYFDIKK